MAHIPRHLRWLPLFLLVACFIFTGCKKEEEEFDSAQYLLDFQAYIQGEWEAESASYHAPEEEYSLNWEGNWRYTFNAPQGCIAYPLFSEETPANYLVSFCLDHNLILTNDQSTVLLQWQSSGWTGWWGSLLCEKIDEDHMRVRDVYGEGQYPHGTYLDVIVVRTP